ncbi:hypothetical protein Q5P01_021740 [Channa striata]|uniref:Uncharacterized protein n=1 Tax=Channa striata TaxID=64152 RepID=A0AA88LUT0_CHASR|nr:hypothetical protein Q5P01_021740 [Channa striata]
MWEEKIDGARWMKGESKWGIDRLKKWRGERGEGEGREERKDEKEEENSKRVPKWGREEERQKCPISTEDNRKSKRGARDQWEDLLTTGIARSQIKAKNVKMETGTTHYYDTAISHVDEQEKVDTTGGSGSCR